MTAITLSEKHSKIRKFVKEHSPYDKEETNRILNKFFRSVPATVRILVGDYRFDSKKVLDIGCSYGQNLLYWREDSEGVEIQEHVARLVRSLGRIVHTLNVEDGFAGLKTENYDAVHTTNLIEHLLSPHLFLMRVHRLLKPGGILAVGCPVVPPFPFRGLWKMFGYRGWLAVEHISFFTSRTLRLTLERAGFRLVHQYFPGFYRISADLSVWSTSIGVQCLSVCEKVDGFKYNSKRLPGYDPLWASDVKQFR
jgi:SAM-dependent methyltransferase